MGDIKLARKQGIVAAYLNITAIFFALVVCVIAISAAVFGYGHTYLLQECLASGMSHFQTTPSLVSITGSFSNKHPWIL